MMELTEVNKITAGMLAKKVINFIVSPRFCEKHLYKFIDKNYTDCKNVKIIQLFGICHKCHRPDIVYYLDYD